MAWVNQRRVGAARRRRLNRVHVGGATRQSSLTSAARRSPCCRHGSSSRSGSRGRGDDVEDTAAARWRGRSRPVAGPRVVVVGVAPGRRGLAARGGAAAVAQPEGDPLRLREEPGPAAQVERLGSCSSTAGMIPASHASRRAWPALIRLPSSSSAVPLSARSCSSVIVTTTVALTPAVCGRAVLRVALDVLHERLAQPPPHRLPLAGLVLELGLGVARRVGEREQLALEHLRPRARAR